MNHKNSIFLLLLVSLFVLSFRHKEPKINVKDSFFALDSPANPQKSIDKKLLDIVAKLPEYQQKAKYIQTLTKGKRGIATMIEKPSEEAPAYYKVTVGYNDAARFETYYLFYVDPKTSDVKILDEMTGEIVSMKTWRERQKEINEG